MNKLIKKTGFTLVELLVVISIIGILTMISVSSYSSAQIKARDSERKSNLDAVSKALMLYYNDNGYFPNLTSDQIFGNSSVGLTGANAIVYMRETPIDPKNVDEYVYRYVVSPSGISFNLFANLENKKDSQCSGGYSVNGIGYTFCYGVSSPNTVVGITLP